MKNSPSLLKKLLQVLTWLIAGVMIILAIGYFTFSQETIDIHLHDTYYVIAPRPMILRLLVVFLLALFVVLTIGHFSKRQGR